MVEGWWRPSLLIYHVGSILFLLIRLWLSFANSPFRLLLFVAYRTLHMLPSYSPPRTVSYGLSS